MLPQTTRILGSQSEDEVDSEAITVRTPNLPPIVGDEPEEEAPFPLVRSMRSPGSTQRMQVLSMRAPASKEHESAWFEKEPPLFVAPGVPEVAEPLGATLDQRHGFVAPSSRGVGFAMVSLLLAGVVAAGSYFFLSARTDEARVPDHASTTQITNAEAPPPVIATPTPVVAPPTPSTTAPEATTTATPVMKTVRTSDLPDSRIDRRKVTTPATEPDLHPDEPTKAPSENTIPTPSPDNPSTPPDIEK